jgi:hypothetical protein
LYNQVVNAVGSLFFQFTLMQVLATTARATDVGAFFFQFKLMHMQVIASLATAAK